MSGHKITRENFHKLDDPKRELILPKKKLFEAFEDLKNKNIADLGSGTGYYTKDLIRLTEPSGAVYCLDVSDELLDILKSRTKDLQSLHYILITEGKIPLENKQIDSVLNVFTAHEFDDLLETLKEIKRIMKTGGKLVIADWSPDGILEQGPPKTKRLSKETIISHSKEAGFEFIDDFGINSEIYILLFVV